MGCPQLLVLSLPTCKLRVRRLPCDLTYNSHYQPCVCSLGNCFNWKKKLQQVFAILNFWMSKSFSKEVPKLLMCCNAVYESTLMAGSVRPTLVDHINQVDMKPQITGRNRTQFFAETRDSISNGTWNLPAAVRAPVRKVVHLGAQFSAFSNLPQRNC